MNLRRCLPLIGVGIFCVFVGAGCGDDDEADAKEIIVKAAEGDVPLRYIDLVPGKGEAIKSGDEVEVHYTGWLTSGKKFDSSLDHGKPFALKIGAGEVIKGWDEGIVGMKVGGKRKLFIPAPLGYGSKGAGKSIPPNSKLIFEVEALKILDPGTVEMRRQMEMMQRQMLQRGSGF